MAVICSLSSFIVFIEALFSPATQILGTFPPLCNYDLLGRNVTVTLSLHFMPAEANFCQCLTADLWAKSFMVNLMFYPTVSQRVVCIVLLSSLIRQDMKKLNHESGHLLFLVLYERPRACSAVM